MLKIEGLNLVLVGLTASIPLLAPFFLLYYFFEVIWLLRRSPYESYKELMKNEESINKLRNQGIIVAQAITS